MSRSAGIAAAIMKHIGDDERQIWDSKKYRPNMTCYHKLLEAFAASDDQSKTITNTKI